MTQSICNVNAIAVRCFLILVLLGTMDTFARESRKSRSRSFIRPALRNRKSNQFNCPLNYAVKNVTFSYKTNRVLKVYCRRFHETNGTARLRKCEWKTNCTLKTEPLPKRKQIKDFTVETNVSSIPRAVRMFNVGRHMQPSTVRHRILLQCCNETCKRVNCTQRRSRLTHEKLSTTDGWLREVLISTTYRSNVNGPRPLMRPMRYETCNYTCWGGYVHAGAAVVANTTPAQITPATSPTTTETSTTTTTTTTETTTTTTSTTSTTTTSTTSTTTTSTTSTTTLSTTQPTTTVLVITGCSTAGQYAELCPCTADEDCAGDLGCRNEICRALCEIPGQDEEPNCYSINEVCKESEHICICAEIGYAISQEFNGNFDLGTRTLADFCCSGKTESGTGQRTLCAAPDACDKDEMCAPGTCSTNSICINYD